MFRRLLLKGSSFCLLVFLSDISPTSAAQKGTLDPEKAVVFYADTFSYDKVLGVWVASGHVEFSQEGRILEADYLTYNEQMNLVTATGSVRLREPEGEVVEADYVELTGDLKEGLLRNVKVLMADKSRLVAHAAIRTDQGRQSTFKQAVYSPCYPCAEKNKAPTWQISAEEITRNEEKKELIAKDPFLDFLGVTVGYLPFLRLSTQRSTGFLSPVFANSTALGVTVGLPYYWAIDPTSDLTVTPFVMVKKGILVGGQYRKIWGKTTFEVDGSVKSASSQKIPVPSKSDPEKKEKIQGLRGHFFFRGESHLTDKWRLKWNGLYTSDKTYGRMYRELSPFSHWWALPFLQSDITLERFSANDYLSVSAITYQGLQDKDESKHTPHLAPSVSYRKTTGPLWKGSFVTFQGNGTSLYRREGNHYQRLIAEGAWTLPHTFSGGQIVTTFASVRGDFYHTRVTDPHDRKKSLYQGNVERLFPQAGVSCQWPLRFVNHLMVMTPMIQMITSPNKDPSSKIPVEDSSGFELNDGNLFNRNRLPGYDRLDAGTRGTWGVSFLFMALQNTRFFFGQSHAFSKVPQDLQTKGLEEKSSDIVGRVQSDPHPWVSLDYRFRFSSKNGRARFNEFFAKFGPEISRLNVNYVHVHGGKPVPGEPHFVRPLDQLGLGLSSQLNKNWMCSVDQVRSLKEGGLLSQSVGVTFKNECLTARFNIAKTYYKDRDVRPGTSFVILVSFLNMGQIKHNFGEFGGGPGTLKKADTTPFAPLGQFG